MIMALLCGEYIYSCNILRWNNIRLAIAKATNEYIVDFKTQLFNDTEPCKDDLYNKSINKNLIITTIDNFINDVKFITLTPHPNIISDSILIRLLKIYLYYLDLLTVIGVSGIYALMNKGDIDGYYSIGNSHDIISMLKTIIPFFEEEDDYMKESIYNIIEIFQASIDNSMTIVITPIENIPYENHSTSLVQNIYKHGSLAHVLFRKRIK